ncbi:MAG TPA: hypothetical protein VN222_09675 [Novosphingobium sp.]|nr:hypothetical protein [Novosphingobium sp.]
MSPLQNLATSLVLCFLATRFWQLPYLYNKLSNSLARVHGLGLITVIAALWVARSGIGQFGKSEILYPLTAQMTWFIHDSFRAMLFGPEPKGANQ